MRMPACVHIGVCCCLLNLQHKCTEQYRYTPAVHSALLDALHKSVYIGIVHKLATTKTVQQSVIDVLSML